MYLMELKKKEQAYSKKNCFYDSVDQKKPSGRRGAVISGSTSGSRSTASSSRAESTAPIWVPQEGVLKSGILAEARRRIQARNSTASGSRSTASSSSAGSTASAWTPGAGSAASGSRDAVITGSKGVAGSNCKWKGAIFEHQSKWKGPIPKWVPKQAANGKGQSKGKWKGPIPKWGPKPPPFPPSRPDPKRMPRPKHTTPPLPPEGQAAEGHAPEQLLHQHTAESAKLRWRFLAWAYIGVDVGRQD